MKDLLQDASSLIAISLFIYAASQLAILGEATVLASRIMP